MPMEKKSNRQKKTQLISDVDLIKKKKNKVKHTDA